MLEGNSLIMPNTSLAHSSRQASEKARGISGAQMYQICDRTLHTLAKIKTNVL